MADSTARGSSARDEAPAGLSEAVLRGLREGAVILMGAVAVLLFAALVTWHPADPGFTFTGEGGEVRNLGGRRGAWLADTLYF
ncbi:MAG: DNA translocase FtsK 4TM domain-containing protein, partial [Planctomycetota bacterium]